MKAVAEAPAKAIITGEHFVVHGGWALAAALPRMVRVELRKASTLSVSSDRFPAGSPPELLPVAALIEAMAKEFSVPPHLDARVTSTIPHGAGLGSSASTMVAVVSAFSRLNSLGLGLDEIVGLAMVGEKLVHGRPSGVDPTISARGGVLLFRPGTEPRVLSLPKPRTFIVSYSGVSRSTRGQIGRVARARKRHPALFSALAESVGELGLSAAKKLEAGDMKGLGRLLTINHAVLGSMGVSTDTLDGMVDLLSSLGAYGAKLTGGGGGGSVIAVAPEGKEKSIVSGLTARGFETFRARVPVGGVKSWLEQ